MTKPMLQTVREVMNSELFAVSPDTSADDVRNGLLGLRVSGAPVLDAEGRPLGVVSLRDLLAGSGASAAERMTRPAAVIEAGAGVEAAARRLVEQGYHRLIVVDEAGRAVGVVSALDVIRSLLGLASVHPAPFPHLAGGDR